MENKNFSITLNFAQDNSEYSNILINTLLICDKKRKEAEDSLKRKIEELEQSNNKALTKQESELNAKHKETLKAKIEELEQSKNEALTKQESELNAKHEETLEAKIEELEQSKGEALAKQESELNAKHEETLKAKIEELEQSKNEALTKQESELNAKHKETLDAKIKELEEEKKKHSELRNKLLDKIKKELDEIVNLLKKDIDDCDNSELKEYIMAIVNQSSGGWNDCNSIDDFIYNCKVGSSAVCRIANLIWWNKQNNIVSILGNIDKIENKMQLVCNLVSVFNHSIKYPDCLFDKTISGYDLYDNGRSNFIDIFKNEILDNGTLCEIRLLSIDEKPGKIYGYYK
ncbi:MAG: hypothetical protein IKJ52_04080 [Muribaculaceae bacterium]|nr:hypothetical protein [Muribaculaceae bacterium]